MNKPEQEQLPQYQKVVQEFVAANRLESSIEFRLIDLVSEVGELSKEILKLSSYGQKELELPSESESESEGATSFSEELGDVFFALVCLANSASLNLDQLLRQALAKYQKRLTQKGQADSGR